MEDRELYNRQVAVLCTSDATFASGICNPLIVVTTHFDSSTQLYYLIEVVAAGPHTYVTCNRLDV